MHEKRGNASKPKRTFPSRIILSVNVMTLATINNKHISTSQCQFFASRIKKSKKLSSPVISIKFYLKLNFFLDMGPRHGSSYLTSKYLTQISLYLFKSVAPRNKFYSECKYENSHMTDLYSSSHTFRNCRN